MKQFYVAGIVMLFFLQTKGQDSLTAKLQERYLNQVSARAAQVSRLIDSKGSKQLDRLRKQEVKLKAKLDAIDPEKSNRLFAKSQQKIADLKSGLKAKLSGAAGGLDGQYSAYLDTMQASVKFMEGSQGGMAKQRIAALQGKLQASDDIQTYINARKKELKEQLAGYSSMGADLKSLNKQTFYYVAQINEYRSMLEDRDKAQRKALELLRNSSVFQKFFQSNSLLSGMFSQGGTGDLVQQLQGLQTRAAVESMVQSRAGTDAAARQVLSAQINQAAEQFENLKDKLPFLKNQGEAPEFKPNPMKSKRTIDRIKLGANVSFDRNRYTVPVMGNFAFQAAYEFNQKSSAGLGISYKMGMVDNGKIRFTSEALGMRSFFDYSLKGALFVNAGFELNRYLGFSGIDELRHWNGFQRTALAGLTVKVKMNAKYKSTSMIAYDFLAARQVPFSNPLIFRMGFTK